jgi:hypothetical protein
MNYHMIESEINDMMAARMCTGLHQNRIVCGFTVNLYRDGYFVVGCDMLTTESGMRVSEFIYERKYERVNRFTNLVVR